MRNVKRPFMKMFLPLCAVSMAVCGCIHNSSAGARRSRAVIRNNTDWLDTEGNPIMAHDGGISRFRNKFYWYGTSYAGNPRGLYGTQHADKNNGFNLYTSTDLVNWHYEGVVLEVPQSGWGAIGTSHRAHVIYNDKTGKYVMWFFHFTDKYPDVFATVAVADKPTGPFEILGQRKTAAPDGYAQDLNVFKDDNGKAYLLYDDGRRNIRVDLLSDDYLSSTGKTTIALTPRHEAPAMIKYKGKYIVAGSGVEGWKGTETHYAVADSPLGPYVEKRRMGEHRTWDSQITDFVYVGESDLVFAMCDSWWNADKTDLNKSRYLWLPVIFEPATDTAKMLYNENWKPFQKHTGAGLVD
jgi:beta-xylosidase